MKRRQEDTEVSKSMFVRKSENIPVEVKAWSSVLLRHICLLPVASCLPSRQSCIYVGRPGYHAAKGGVSWSLATSCLLWPHYLPGNFLVFGGICNHGRLLQAYTPAELLFRKQDWLLPLTSVSDNQIYRKV